MSCFNWKQWNLPVVNCINISSFRYFSIHFIFCTKQAVEIRRNWFKLGNATAMYQTKNIWIRNLRIPDTLKLHSKIDILIFFFQSFSCNQGRPQGGGGKPPPLPKQKKLLLKNGVIFQSYIKWQRPGKMGQKMDKKSNFHRDFYI